MRRFRLLGLASVCALCSLIALSGAAFAQAEKITLEEYRLQLAGLEKRTAEAKRSTAACKEASDKITAEMASIDAQIAAMKADVYRLCDTDEAGYNAYMKELDQIEARLMSLLSLSDGALFDKREEVNGIEDRVAQLKKMKLSLVPDAKVKLANIDRLLERVNSRLPRKRIKPYTVLPGDSLWKIAKSPNVYSDPYMWPRIYVENRSKIKDPDLIYPNWVLNLPFGVEANQHLVLKGHNLSAVAGIVYKDVMKWSKIYQANKSQILDPNLIFPAQVLDIPAN
jgi:nucleoid-associated protein YgaU